MALRQRSRFRRDTALIVDGTLVPARDHSVAEQSKNYRYSTAHQVVIDADTRRVVVVGRPLPGSRHDSRDWEESGAKAAVGKTMMIADGGYQGTGLVIPHRRRTCEELLSWKEQHNRAHKQVRARVEHVFARMKSWKILRDCRLKGDGVPRDADAPGALLYRPAVAPGARRPCSSCRPRSTTHSGGGGRISSPRRRSAPRRSETAIQPSICAREAVACWTTTRHANRSSSRRDGESCTHSNI